MDSHLKKDFTMKASPNNNSSSAKNMTNLSNPVNPLQTDNTPKDEKADLVATTSATNSEIEIEIDVHVKGVTPQTVFCTLKAAGKWLPLILQLLQLINPIPSAQPNFPPTQPEITQPEITQPEIIQPSLTYPADRASL